MTRLAQRWSTSHRLNCVAIVDQRGRPIFIRRHNNLNAIENCCHADHVVALHNAWLDEQGEPAPPAARSP